MPKMRGLLRSRPKVDEEELALSRARIAARIEDLLANSALPPADDPSAADARTDQVADANGTETDAASSGQSVVPGPWLGRRRPRIVVVGDPGVDGIVDRIEMESGDVTPIGVMAQPGEDVGGDEWRLPIVDATSLTLDPSPRDATAADEEPMAAAAESGARAAADPEPAAGSPEPAAASPEPVAAEPPNPAPTQPSSRRASAAKPAGATRRPSTAKRGTKAKARSRAAPPASCPYCAVLLLPPPAASRRCEQCRKRIVVRRVEGRAVYLTEAAVLVFEAERRRVASSGRLARERKRWLQLAESAGASGPRATRLAGAPLSEDVVSAARALYFTTVDRAFRAARRDHEWETASRIRRDQATALYRIARSPLPPPAEIVATYREGVLAELRRIAEVSREAELVSGACCDGCRADDRRVFRIGHEVREPRLPHAGCPRGLCRCRWDLAARDRTTMRRLLRRGPRPESRASQSEPVSTA